MDATIYVGMSIDGFIARPDHTVDFLEVEPAPEDDMGFAAFMASIDVLVMGRNTYEFVMGAAPEWPYGELRVVVLTTRELTVPDAIADRVSAWSGHPATLLDELSAAGHNHAYIDGGSVAQQFLSAGLISQLILTSVPILIGQGVRLFGDLPGDVLLDHQATKTYANGMFQTTYDIRSQG